MATERRKPIDDRSTHGRNVMADREQLTLPLQRGDQLGLLRALPLSSAYPSPDGKRVSGAACKALLRAIDDRAGVSGWCFVPVPWLAREANVSLRVARRALAVLRDIGLLIDEPARVANSPRLRLKLCWPNVVELVEERRKPSAAPAEDSSERSAQCHSGTLQSATRAPHGATRAMHGATVALSYPSAPSAHQAPPPNAARAAAGPATIDRQAAAELESLGVEWPAKALDTAARFHTPELIAQLIAFYREHAAASGWGPGALVARLRNPAQLVDRGWPPASARARSAAQAAEFATRQAAALQETQQRRQQADDDERRLEAEHGEDLDTMPAEAVEQLAARIFAPVSLQHWKRNPSSPALRRRLLRALAGDLTPSIELTPPKGFQR